MKETGSSFGYLDAGLAKGGDFLFGEHFIEGFRHHEVEGFLQQGGASDHAFDDTARGLAAAEARDVDAGDGAAVGTFEEGVFILGFEFDRQR